MKKLQRLKRCSEFYSNAFMCLAKVFKAAEEGRQTVYTRLCHINSFCVPALLDVRGCGQREEVFLATGARGVGLEGSDMLSG